MPTRDVLPPTAAPPSAITLGEFVLLAARFWWLLLLAMLAGGAFMFVSSVSGPRVYQSSAVLSVSASKLGQEGTTLPVAAYRPLIESRSTAKAVMRETGLDKPPYSFSITQFLEDVVSVEEIRGTNLLRITVTLTNGALASDVANQIAAHTIELVRTANANEAIQARDMFKALVDVARLRLNETDRSLRVFQQSAQIDAVRKDVDAQLTERGKLLELNIRIAAERGKLARLEEELKAHPPVRSTRKTIDSDPVLTEAARTNGATVLGMHLDSQALSEVYDTLDQAASESRATLAGLEKQQHEVAQSRRLNAPLPQLSRLYDLEEQQARLKVERDLAAKIYEDLATRFEVARLQVVSRSAQLNVIDPATPADRPVPRHVVRNTVAGSTAAFALTLAALLLWRSGSQVVRRSR
jgi:uncharacterized protein involved in exopolysaccharide biosynthesis